MSSCTVTQGRITKCTWCVCVCVYGSNVKIIVNSEIHKICQCFFFVYEGQVTLPLLVAVIKLLTERNAFLFFSDIRVLENGHYAISAGLTELTMKSAIFWDVMLCKLLSDHMASHPRICTPS
jgi:hypothetical protein